MYVCGVQRWLHLKYNNNYCCLIAGSGGTDRWHDGHDNRGVHIAARVLLRLPSTLPRCFGLRALVAEVFRAPCAPQRLRDCAEVSTCWTAGGAPRNCTCDPTATDGPPSVVCEGEKSENPISCLPKIVLALN